MQKDQKAESHFFSVDICTYGYRQRQISRHISIYWLIKFVCFFDVFGGFSFSYTEFYIRDWQ